MSLDITMTWMTKKKVIFCEVLFFITKSEF